jgi:hypothetical protein
MERKLRFQDEAWERMGWGQEAGRAISFPFPFQFQ